MISRREVIQLFTPIAAGLQGGVSMSGHPFNDDHARQSFYVLEYERELTVAEVVGIEQAWEQFNRDQLQLNPPLPLVVIDGGVKLRRRRMLRPNIRFNG